MIGFRSIRHGRHRVGSQHAGIGVARGSNINREVFTTAGLLGLELNYV
jgi:hypothetical protein